MAIRLLDEWMSSSKNPAPVFTHTAIDDLESFLWVLIWVVLERYRRRHGEFPELAARWWSTMSSASAQVHAMKEYIFVQIKSQDRPKLRTKLGPISPFAKLILGWGYLAIEARAVLTEMLEDPLSLTLDFYQGFYEKYLQLGFAQLDEMPDTGVGWGQEGTGA
jgi:hypothetical protein